MSPGHMGPDKTGRLMVSTCWGHQEFISIRWSLPSFSRDGAPCGFVSFFSDSLKRGVRVRFTLPVSFSNLIPK